MYDDRPSIGDLMSINQDYTLEKNFFVKAAVEHRDEPIKIQGNFCFSKDYDKDTISFYGVNSIVLFGCPRCGNDYEFFLENAKYGAGYPPIFHRTPYLRERFKDSFYHSYNMSCKDCKLPLGEFISFHDEKSYFLVVNDNLLKNLTPYWVHRDVLSMISKHFQNPFEDVDYIKQAIEIWIDKGIREGNLSKAFYATSFISDCDILFKRTKMIDDKEHLAFIKRVAKKDKKLADEFYKSAQEGEERITHAIKLVYSRWPIYEYWEDCKIKRAFKPWDSKPDGFIIIQGETFVDLLNMVIGKRRINYKEWIKELR